jgi:hypothetical protein
VQVKVKVKVKGDNHHSWTCDPSKYSHSSMALRSHNR